VPNACDRLGPSPAVEAGCRNHGDAGRARRFVIRLERRPRARLLRGDVDIRTTPARFGVHHGCGRVEERACATTGSHSCGSTAKQSASPNDGFVVRVQWRSDIFELAEPTTGERFRDFVEAANWASCWDACGRPARPCRGRYIASSRPPPCEHRQPARPHVASRHDVLFSPSVTRILARGARPGRLGASGDAVRRMDA